MWSLMYNKYIWELKVGSTHLNRAFNLINGCNQHKILECGNYTYFAHDWNNSFFNGSFKTRDRGISCLISFYIRSSVKKFLHLDIWKALRECCFHNLRNKVLLWYAIWNTSSYNEIWGNSVWYSNQIAPINIICNKLLRGLMQFNGCYI